MAESNAAMQKPNQTTQNTDEKKPRQKRRAFISHLAAGAVIAGTRRNLFAIETSEERIIQPKEIDKVLVHPAMGMQTYVSKWPKVAAKNHPETSMLYCRLEWADLEPEEGQYNLGVLEKHLQVARQQGKDLAIRFHPYSKIGMEGVSYHMTPEWFRKKHKGLYC